jgi:hypothetical protein
MYKVIITNYGSLSGLQAPHIVREVLAEWSKALLKSEQRRAVLK